MWWLGLLEAIAPGLFSWILSLFQKKPAPTITETADAQVTEKEAAIAQTQANAPKNTDDLVKDIRKNGF